MNYGYVCMQSASRLASVRVRPTPLLLAVIPTAIFLRQLLAAIFGHPDQKGKSSDIAIQGTVSLMSAKGTSSASGMPNPQNGFAAPHIAIRARQLAHSNHLLAAKIRQCSRAAGTTLRTVQFV